MPIDLNNLLTNENITLFFVRAFAIVLSFIYLLYALVIARQVGVMNRTLQTSIGAMLTFIAYIQVIIGIGLIIYAIFLI